MTAYSYLSPPPTEKYPYEEWRSPFISSEEKPEWKVTLGESAVKGSEATVDVTVDTLDPVVLSKSSAYSAYHLLPQERGNLLENYLAYVWWLFY